ncbi:MAG: hypothetical protein KGL46_07030 [Hyphomicrobiales bacterium]|nr:hypothetical protein [Hyphomicrobiales bacterium]
MASIPGKTCGACNMCCKSLEIEHFNKPMGVLCKHWKDGCGCSIYETRPQVCRDFECDWKEERSLGPQLRPDKVGTILFEDPDSDDYQAVCDPSRQMAWRQPLIFKHLVQLAKGGQTVIAKSGLKAWRIYPNGQAIEWS